MTIDAGSARVWQLKFGYEMRLMGEEQALSLLREWQPKMFSNDGTIFPAFTDAEKAATKNLGARMGQPLHLYFGLFQGDTFAGWHVGDQRSAREFYMRNSAVLPEHRRKGLYSAMLSCVKEYLLEMGFQEITSSHIATNNAVIIPKLKQGFVITGIEVSDYFGTLVILKFFANSGRRHVMDYRVGMIAPDDRINGMKKGR